MYVNHLYNPLPCLLLQVCCDDACVHAQHYEKPNSISRGTISIPKGLGLRMKTAFTEVSRLLRAAMAVVLDMKISDRQPSRLTFYIT